MPLLQPPHQFLDVPVRPLTIGGVPFQRVTRYLSHTPEQDPRTGEMKVLLTVQVRHFLTRTNGTAGADASELVPPYALTYLASNIEAVDVSTGRVVFTRLQETNAEWLALLQADPRTLMLRGDAFEAQLHAGAVDIVPQIRAAMEAADAAPFYRFGGAPDTPGPSVL